VGRQRDAGAVLCEVRGARAARQLGAQSRSSAGRPALPRLRRRGRRLPASQCGAGSRASRLVGRRAPRLALVGRAARGEPSSPRAHTRSPPPLPRALALQPAQHCRRGATAQRSRTRPPSLDPPRPADAHRRPPAAPMRVPGAPLPLHPSPLIRCSPAGTARPYTRPWPWRRPRTARCGRATGSRRPHLGA
jgi:hypothetical protein